MLAERMIGGQRLGGIHVQRGGGDLARVQRGHQVVLHDDFAARAIHDAHLRFHLGERRRVQHPARLVGHRHVDGDEIRVPINVVQVADQFDAERLGAGFGQERVVGQHAHAEGQRALGDFAADAAHAEHAERLARQFGALETACGPICRRPSRRGPAAPCAPGSGSWRRTVRRWKWCCRPGVFITTTPRCVAASTSTLSTPTPARPTTRNCGAASMTLARHLGFGPDHHRHDVFDDGQQFRFGQPFGQHDDLELRAAVAAAQFPWARPDHKLRFS